MTATAPQSTSPRSGDVLRRIPLAEIHESPLNPRKHFDDAALEQLTASMLASGQIEPCLARPRGKGGVELAAGHRRRRAALRAMDLLPVDALERGLDQLDVILRPMDDRQFIEALNVDNLQRDDLHAMEESDGFVTLMKECGYDVKALSVRMGKSERYIYDSISLQKLVKEAKALFLADAFARAHAVEIARLTPAQQRELIDKDNVGSGYRREGLWQVEVFHRDPTQGDLDLEDDDEHVKPVSVRELRTYIDDHFRATPETIDPFLLPDTAQLLAEAQTKKGRSAKIVHITYDYRVPDAARDPKVRTYGDNAWFRADGQFGSKVCDHQVVGLVVAGPGRGQAFLVCIAKEKCAVHWSAWQKEKKSRQRAQRANGRRSRGGPATSAADEAKAQARAAAAKREEKITAELISEIQKATKVRLADLGNDALLPFLHWEQGGWWAGIARRYGVEKPKKPNFIEATRYMALVEAARRASQLYHRDYALRFAKDVGIDAKAILKAITKKHADVGKRAPKGKPVKKRARKAKA